MAFGGIYQSPAETPVLRVFPKPWCARLSIASIGYLVGQQFRVKSHVSYTKREETVQNRHLQNSNADEGDSGASETRDEKYAEIF